MLRHILLPAFLYLASCASTQTSELVVDQTFGGSTGAASVAVVPPAPVTSPALASTEVPALAEPAAPAEPAASPFTPAEESLYDSRFTVKAGYWGSSEDALDDGYILGVSWMKFLSKILALEFEVGYVDADGSEGGIDVDLWSMPIMVNGRVNLPVWILDVYGGLGVGTIYYDADVSGGGSDDGFLLGGNAFVGASLGIADRMSLGLEGKYYVTEDADDLDEGLDAFALMLTLGFSN